AAENARSPAGRDRSPHRGEERRPQAPRLRRSRPHPPGADRERYRSRGRTHRNTVEKGLGRLGRAAALVLLAGGHPLLASGPPEPSSTRDAFLLQFPKSEATAAALELEELCAAIGIELSPRAFGLPDDKAAPDPLTERGRADPRAAFEFARVTGALGGFVFREV